MLMHNFQSLSLRMMIAMTFLLPIWLVAGRALLGVIGWVTFILMYAVVPTLLIVLVVLGLLTKYHVGSDGKRYIGKVDSILYWSVYISIFLCGIFMPEFGDTEESYQSVLTRIFGNRLMLVSEIMTLVFVVLSVGSVIVLFGVLLYERFRKPLP